ncbi:MAG: polysaccharide deacetylase family protein [Actinobacteria bacterium]|nr:polysaccharide deacetylase family protein [Actinomycetota bacterium]
MGRRLLVLLFAAASLLFVPDTFALSSTYEPKVMYLTFDDGPNPLFTPIVLRILQQHGARATFFPTGRTLSAFWDDEEAQDLLDRGHAVGSHSWVHRQLPDLTPGELEEDILRANGVLRRRTGFTPTCFRAPYGITDRTVEDTLDRMNLALVGWDADPAEWSNPSIGEALAHIDKWEHDGMIVLFHDRKWQTLSILQAVLREYEQEGWTFEALPECLVGASMAVRQQTRAPGNGPIGGLEALDFDAGRREHVLGGWAYDADSPEGGLEIRLDIDGEPTPYGRTGDDHRFEVRVPAATAGPLCLWARNSGTQREDAFLGCHADRSG